MIGILTVQELKLMEARLLTDRNRISVLECLPPRLILLSVICKHSLTDFARTVSGVRQAYHLQRASQAQSKALNNDDGVSVIWR